MKGCAVPALAFAAGALLALATAAHGQGAAPMPVNPIYRQVAIPYGIKLQMAAAWDDTDPRQVERAYCATYHVTAEWGITVYHVDSLTAPDLVWLSTPTAVGFHCGPGQAQAHVHTPTTCQSDMMTGVRISTCEVGGAGAYVCEPSPQDRRNLLHRGDPFALLICDRFAVMPYYRDIGNTSPVPGQ